MLHEFVSWIQLELGKATPDGVSWSQALIESLTFWNLLEGTHLLSLMIFVGTIMLVDLRMLGLIFKSTPLTQISARVLPPPGRDVTLPAGPGMRHTEHRGHRFRLRAL